MIMKPFDLQKALAGEPVVTRSGDEVTQIHMFDLNSMYADQADPLYAVVSGLLYSYNEAGTYHENGTIDDRDLFMKSSSILVNGIEVEAGIESLPDTPDSCYYIPSMTIAMYAPTTLEYQETSYYLDRRLLYTSKEGAISRAKAMLGIKG